MLVAAKPTPLRDYYLFKLSARGGGGGGNIINCIHKSHPGPHHTLHERKLALDEPQAQDEANQEVFYSHSLKAMTLCLRAVARHSKKLEQS